MQSSYPFTELPQIVMDMAHPYDPLDPALVDQSFLACDTPCQPPISLLESQAAEAQYAQQCEIPTSPYFGYSWNENSYGDPLSPWDSGLSTISDSQSPPSSGIGSVPSTYYESPPFLYNNPMLEPPQSDSFRDIKSSLALSDKPIDIRSECHPLAEMPWPSHPTPQMPLEIYSEQKNHPSNRSKPARSRARNERRTSTLNRRRRASPSSERTFTCSFAPYGCESIFVSKNEWKRHVNSKHLLLGFYRCDVGKCKTQKSAVASKSAKAPSTPQPGQPNDFNRKDLFTQHQRRMHAPWLQGRQVPIDSERDHFESGLEEIRRRCWHGLRQPPMESHCGFCGKVFVGVGSWDVRMEHVGRHFERDELGPVEDLALREWGVREGILVFCDGRYRLA